MNVQSLAVFCGSSSGTDPIYMNVARELGERLAEQKKTLVYGGARVGCMGAVADGCLSKGGKVYGVIPERLTNVEIAHAGLTELHTVETMHERKAKMAELADAFVALPGGAGTLEEWFEVFTWAQLGYHEKPACILNVNGFFDPLLEMLQHTIEQGFMKPEYRDTILVAESPEELIQIVEDHHVKPVSKWE
ncbi:TIGR00730 family Rossman fold protein [Geomicrobium sp. JSM 1781026]